MISNNWSNYNDINLRYILVTILIDILIFDYYLSRMNIMLLLYLSDSNYGRK